MAVYVVGGWLRSGTSMMMECLDVGGLPAYTSPQVEQRQQRRYNNSPEYQGNPRYHEIGPGVSGRDDFPFFMDGQVFKSLRQSITLLPAGKHAGYYKACLMRRDPEEIRQSMSALFNQRVEPAQAAMIDRYIALIADCLNQRADVDLIEVDYRSVVNDPMAAFQRMADHGWPIDPEKAASVVDARLCRYRRENLEDGI